MAKKLAESLIRYKIEQRILAVTCDNAENNSTMMTHLELLIPQVRGRAVRVRCMAHVINLVVKVSLALTYAVLQQLTTLFTSPTGNSVAV